MKSGDGLKPSLGILTMALAIALAPAALAGNAQMEGLASQEAHQQFVVAYRTSVQRTAESVRHDLQQAATAVGRALQLEAVRETAVGTTVVRADRPLDRIEAERLLRALSLSPLVDYAAPDLLLQPMLDPNDPGLTDQWAFGDGAAALNVRKAWDQATGSGVVVAVIDTGITRHPDLDANVVAGYDFIGDASNAGDGDGRDGDATDTGDFDETRRSSWHGTHVAGTVAAVTGNAQGVAGTAYNARIQPLRVLGHRGAFDSDVADAIVWAAGAQVGNLPMNRTPARVINLSLGKPAPCTRQAAKAIAMAVERGATVVAAAGNWANDVAGNSPAGCPGVIAVASTTSAGRRAGDSSYGARITVSAPGDSILSTYNSGMRRPEQPAYAVLSGTSMAAPHVAGVIALLQSVAPQPLSPSQVAAVLRQTARPLRVACPEGCGAGIVDAHAAVMAVKHIEPDPGPDPDPDPVAIQLQPGVPVSVSGAAGSEHLYRIEVPAGTQQLSVLMSGGSGTAELYTRYADLPTDAAFNCRPKDTGNNKGCISMFPERGTWYVRIKGTRSFNGVSLVAHLR